MKQAIHIGMDFNAANCNAVCGLFYPERRFIHVFHEFVSYFDTPELITAIKEYFDGYQIYVYPDASGKKRSSINAHTSDIALLREAKFRIKAKSSNPLVRDRVASVNRAFEKGYLAIDVNRCPETTECLEKQVFLENGQPDKKSGYDHLVEALGYLVHYIMPVRKNNVTKVTAVG
ncbi:MAG: hypothetical protein R3250_00105 [Melioribacteraceae bacterium]|nr:hypothetical protein [Melioribacteraceae bacterium]